MPGVDIPMLHGQAEADANRARIRRVLIVFLFMTAVAAALVIFSLIWRDATHMHNPNEQASQMLTIGVTLLWGALILFFWGMKLSPLLCYRKYLREIHRGLSRTVEGVLTRVDEGLTFRDGINFIAVIVNVGNLEEPEDDRLLYWDARLRFPDISPGRAVRAQAHGNDIIGLIAQ